MTIDYTDQGKVKLSMFDYLEEEFIGKIIMPASSHLFKTGKYGIGSQLQKSIFITFILSLSVTFVNADEIGMNVGVSHSPSGERV